MNKRETACAKKRVIKTARPAMPRDDVVYLFDSDFIGPNRELGKVLSNGFLGAMASLPQRQSTIVLISNGVRLAAKGSYALEPLEKLQKAGYRILICGTCLDYFKLREKVKVGTVSNAVEILECMAGGANVVKF